MILRNCRRAMHADGKVLIVERMIFDDPEKSLPTLLSDLNMPVLTGGRERTEEEYALVRERRTAADERGSGRVPLWHLRRCAELVPRIEVKKRCAQRRP